MTSGRRLTLLGCLGLAASFAVTLWVLPWSDERVNDLLIYRADVFNFLHGYLPYRDVPFEYPPLAAPALTLPGLFGTGRVVYRDAFAAMMFVLAVVVLELVRRLARRTGGDERLAVLAVAVSPLLCAAMIRNHFDLLPVALTLGAILLIVCGRGVAGLAVLGVGVMTKGFPVVVAPVALAWLVARGERRQAVLGAAALGAVVVAVATCAVAISPSGSLDAIRYQTDRPVQIESLASFGLRAVDGLGGPAAREVSSYRSDGLLNPYGGLFTALSALVGVAAVGLLALGAWRRPRDPRAFVLASLGAVAAFATFGKVLSPQYLVWVLPLGALALAWRRWVLAGVVAAATLLTFVEFPRRYFDLVDGDAFPLAVVAVRDALLVVAVGMTVIGVRAGRGLER